ncbi:hypothetical protein BOTBODRAFT_129343 [Botryobasidium botryosum FD-172 SS1]|uniref:DNA-directed RNA polymerase n=1 Tax=Botryobasidium botryosum (strain FD-172 SS1) TaxID=930990 RepID=A0A067MYP3_BOTB1|nr:hypothetical protein BOTBODRAFT_129343 [Botryobasidium botryosum FD-172 SS1]
MAFSRRIRPAGALRELDSAARAARRKGAPARDPSLPGPSRRFYSAPSKRASAASAAAVMQEAPMHSPPPPPSQTSQLYPLSGFSISSALDRQIPFTLLPTPLPDDRNSPLNDIHYTSSRTQSSLAVIAACLHQSHDVRRAKMIFEDLRDAYPQEKLLDVGIYNSFLSAYLDMAARETGKSAAKWVDDAWTLFAEMRVKAADAEPDCTTYAAMLLFHTRFKNCEDLYSAPSPAELLRTVLARQIPLSSVISNPVIESSEDAAQIIALLQQSAVELGRMDVLIELGHIRSQGQEDADPLEGVPEVMPVMAPSKKLSKKAQKAAEDAGLPTDVGQIPFNLSTLRDNLNQVLAARKALPDDATARQKLLEESAYDAAFIKFKHDSAKFEGMGLGSKGLHHNSIQGWMWGWYQKLVARLEAEIADLIKQEAKNPNLKETGLLSPFVTLLKPQKLAVITIIELMRLQGSGGIAEGMKTARALLSVGRAVETEFHAEMLKRRDTNLTTEHGKGLQGIVERRKLARSESQGSGSVTTEWTQTVRVRVGSFLVDSLMDVAVVTRSTTDQRGEVYTEDQPAFSHGYEYLRGRKLGVIKLNPVVAERLAKDPLRETLHPRHLPMLTKPRPWLGHNDGGYLFNKSFVMRIKDSIEQLSYLRTASQENKLELVFASLDVLGSTPWKINKAVFDVVLKVWNTGEQLGKIPPAVLDLPEPEKPADYDTDNRAKMNYLLGVKELQNKKRNNHSERCAVNYKMEIARSFLGETFYFPHNIDFRGRAYPIPAHLNHIGNDLSRGILMFGESKPLGERGLRWLKIHLANLYGFDKASFDEREQFTMDHLEDVYDSATNPLEGKRWWTKADDPWQCLATCMELKNALDSPDPLAFESFLPVHQDGTCNGLQHYAALGGDNDGAKQVNLAVTDRPSDVYTYVADMVEKQLDLDCAAGHKYALMIRGKVSRKVVKQTVMTTVYGVTYVGARAQIEKQLKERGDIPREECWDASSYLAKKTLACIGDLFKGAKAIQNWFSQSARLIAKSLPPDRVDEAKSPLYGRGTNGKGTKVSKGSRMGKEQMTSVIWTTPLDLPIVQPYRKTKKKQVMTALQTVYISDPNLPTEVNAPKQASAFPPNFIHSLDATHMMLTALACRGADLTFASVHDSYWTHASTVDQMSAIIRDTFIQLHSSDILGKLLDEFKERYKGYKVPVVAITKQQKVGRASSVVVLPKDQVDSLDGEQSLVSVQEDTKKAKDEEDEEEDDMEESEVDSKAPTTPVMGKFVDLIDILPPLPKKGDFSVATVERSLYFFS